jgi:hypothetical protein
MKLEKIRSFDVPVREMGLPHQRVGVGKEGLEAGNDGVRLRFGGGLSAHGMGSFSTVA